MGLFDSLAGVLGIGSTQSGFNATPAAVKQSDYSGAINSSMGLSDQTREQQQQLLQMLMQQAQGQGPAADLAKQQLQQATQQQQQQSAGLMASQRGLNPALAQREILNSQANTGQQMAGQGAALQAQNRLAGMQQLGGALGTQRSQDIGQLQNLGNLQNAQNSTNVQNQASANQLNAGTAMGNAGNSTKVIGGLISGAGAALGMAGGGEVYGDYKGKDPVGARSYTGAFMQGLGNSMADMPPPDISRPEHVNAMTGSTPMPTPNIDYSKMGMQTAWSGGPIDYTAGGKLPGKAEVKGDSLKNDKVPIMGSPGEIMLPRTVAMHPDAPNKAKEFVAALMAKKHLKGKK